MKITSEDSACLEPSYFGAKRPSPTKEQKRVQASHNEMSWTYTANAVFLRYMSDFNLKNLIIPNLCNNVSMLMSDGSVVATTYVGR